MSPQNFAINPLYLLAILLIVIIIIALFSDEKELKKCEKALIDYYSKLKKDEYARRKLYKENFIYKDEKKEYSNIAKALVIKHLESKKCNYKRLKNKRTLLRGVPAVTKQVVEFMKKENKMHKDFETFLGYK